MKKRMLFFVNPNAGHTEIRAHLMDVLDIFTRGGYEVTVHPTARPGEMEEAIAAEGGRYDVVAAAGGDGTVNEAVNGLMRLENPPVFGYLPGGTVNDVAATLGLSRKPEEAAAVLAGGEELRIDLGCFNGRWFAYVAAFGAFTAVPYDTDQNDKRLLGRTAYFLRGVKALGEIRPIHVRVIVDGMRFEENVIFGAVCSTTSIGGFRARGDLGVSLTDGLSEVVLVREAKNLADLNGIATALLRQEFTGEYIRTFRAGRVTFEFDEEIPWTLDGEFGGNVQKAEILNRQRALRIMAPGAEAPEACE